MNNADEWRRRAMAAEQANIDLQAEVERLRELVNQLCRMHNLTPI